MREKPSETTCEAKPRNVIGTATNDFMGLYGRGSRIRTCGLKYPKLPRYRAALYPDGSRVANMAGADEQGASFNAPPTTAHGPRRGAPSRAGFRILPGPSPCPVPAIVCATARRSRLGATPRRKREYRS